jgi:hypothetical protein
VSAWRISSARSHSHKKGLRKFTNNFQVEVRMGGKVFVDRAAATDECSIIIKSDITAR